MPGEALRRGTCRSGTQQAAGSPAPISPSLETWATPRRRQKDPDEQKGRSRTAGEWQVHMQNPRNRAARVRSAPCFPATRTGGTLGGPVPHFFTGNARMLMVPRPPGTSNTALP